MRKLILLVFEAAAGICSAATTYNLANGNVTVPANTTAIITQSNNGTALAKTITIGNGATVTLNGINLVQDGQNASLIKCLGNATIILADGSVNRLGKTTTRYDQYPVQIAGSSSTTVTIKGETAGTGKLIAIAPNYNRPGIGGHNGGNICIEGGIIDATGSESASGIGAGDANTSSSTGIGNITIKGGKVTARGDYSGIGYGYNSKCGVITISGGTVNASGYWRAGIESSTNIEISGGTVNATNRHTSAYDLRCGIYAGGTLKITEGITKVVAGVYKNGNRPIAAGKGLNISSILTDETSANGQVRTLTFPTYTITWKNDNGSTLKTTKNVRHGTVPVYDGATPTKASTEQYIYTFKGWSSAVVAATADKTYTATYTANLRSYTVTWKNDDGSTLKSESVLYGTTPDYGGEPEKQATDGKTYAFAGWTPEVVPVTEAVTYAARYVKLNPEEPVITPDSGTVFEESLNVSMSCPTEGATIHYTLDGSEPTVESPVYKRFRIYGKTTVKAVAEKNGLVSDVVAAEYAPGRCVDPVISLADGASFAHSNKTVSIRWKNDGILRYTIDGTDPTAESPVYEEPFSFSDSVELRVKVFSDDFFDSAIVTSRLTRVWENVPTPQIEAATPFTGSKSKVVIFCAVKGATIRYTLDGNEPDEDSTVYDVPIYVTDSCTVKAYAVMPDYLDSAVVTQEIVKVWGIGDSLGKPDHGFATDGSAGAGWTRVVDATAPNGEAMKSGAITHNQTSTLSTTVMGPGTLTFSWRISCEEDPDGRFEWDHAEFAVDGAMLLQLDGEKEWRQESVRIEGEGEHSVAWTYVKDDVESEGEDAAWVAGYGWVSDLTETETTEVPVPYAWLLQYDPEIVDEYDAYEAAAKATAANGRNKVWECYVAGISPTNETAQLTAKIEIKDGEPVVTWEPDLNAGGATMRTYKVYGSETLENGGDWQYPARPQHKFFKVSVEMP